MSSGYTIQVTGLSPDTTEAKLNDFFSFCGKLASVQRHEKSATLVFEKESAAKTALMLNGGTLDGAHLEVTSATPSVPSTSTPATFAPGTTASTPIGATEGHHIEQEDKPKAGIVAEYLAHGYILSDHIVERAIEMDHKQGISSRFLNYIDSLDHKVGEKVVGPEKTVSGKLNEHLHTAVAKTKEVDANRGVSKTAVDYYSKALNTNVGQKVLSFYTTTTKQVLDVHEEARRIADSKKAAAGGTSPAAHEVSPVVASVADHAAAKTTDLGSSGPAPVGEKTEIV